MVPDASSAVGRTDLAERVAAVRWYHTLELAPGVVTDGLFDHRPYLAKYGLPDDLSGLRAVDIGSQDGFWAFELERRGAQVVALDIDRPEDLDWPPRLRERGETGEAGGFPLARKEAFGIAREALGSSVDRRALSVYDATPERLGHFDLVFAGSILVHLRDPALALQRMAGLCRGRFVLADAVSRRLDWVPGLKLAEFTGESPWMTWWMPTGRTWAAMARCAGFEDVRVHARFNMKLRAQRAAVPHAVIHARGPV